MMLLLTESLLTNDFYHFFLSFFCMFIHKYLLKYILLNWWTEVLMENLRATVWSSIIKMSIWLKLIMVPWFIFHLLIHFNEHFFVEFLLKTNKWNKWIIIIIITFSRKTLAPWHSIHHIIQGTLLANILPAIQQMLMGNKVISRIINIKYINKLSTCDVVKFFYMFCGISVHVELFDINT